MRPIGVVLLPPVIDQHLGPTLGWTPTNLSSWYGIRIDVVRRLLAELVEHGVIRREPGRGERYLLKEQTSTWDHRPRVRPAG